MRVGGCAVASLMPQRPRVDPGTFYLWWTEWYWERVFSKFFGFPLSLSLHQHSLLIFHSSTTSLY